VISLSTSQTTEISPEEVSIPPMISGQNSCFQYKMTFSALATFFKLGKILEKMLFTLILSFVVAICLKQEF